MMRAGPRGSASVANAEATGPWGWLKPDMEPEGSRPGGRARSFDALDRVLVVVVAGLVLAPLIGWVVPGLTVRFYAVGLDLVVDATSALVTFAVAALLWLRSRERPDPVSPVQAAAFLVLSIANIVALSLALARLDAGARVAAVLPDQAPLYVASGAHILAASLLVASFTGRLRRATLRQARILALLGIAGLAMLLAVAQLAGSDLAPLSSPFAGPSSGSGAADPAALPTATALGWYIGIVDSSLFLVAAFLSRRQYRDGTSISDAFLSVGFVFSAFAQLHLAVLPSTYPGLVSEGDLLRIGFDVVLLLGIEAEARSSLASLRLSIADLHRLRSVDADRAAIEERARLARELHDGLSQDLWLAKLKVGRLEALPGLGTEAMALTEELEAAVDAGLANARQAVIALRWIGDPDAPFRDQLARYVDDFADRRALRAELTCEHELPVLAPRAEAELLRIAQEALNNIARHADATFVRVLASVEQGTLRLGVVDNGRGFDPEAVGESSFGLTSMRERASLIGARLRIDSRPQSGTEIWVELPLSAAIARSTTA